MLVELPHMQQFRATGEAYWENVNVSALKRIADIVRVGIMSSSVVIRPSSYELCTQQEEY